MDGSRRTELRAANGRCVDMDHCSVHRRTAAGRRRHASVTVQHPDLGERCISVPDGW
jgi:hypothetical protein